MSEFSLPAAQSSFDPTGFDSQISPVTLTRASVYRRLGAKLIDGVVLWIIVGMLSMLITPNTSLWWDFFVYVAIMASSQVYYFWFYSTSGQTLGKLLFKIVVVSTDGRPLDWRTGLLRTVGMNLSSLVFGIGYFRAFWDKSRQTWHDKLAGTSVVLVSLDPEVPLNPYQPQTARQPLSSGRALAIAVAVVVYLGCYGTSILQLLPPVQQAMGQAMWSLVDSSGFDNSVNLYDADYARVSEALSRRWDLDDSIPTASMGFDIEGTPDQMETWFAIEISYTGTCTTGPDDPCEQLADELAGVVFDSYPRVDELTGISILIGDEPHYLNIDPLDVVYEKSLEIDEWRQDLGIAD